MIPTKERNHVSLFLNYNGKGFLFDCGEGTQRQMKIAGIPLAKINKIFISHWHGDHVLGLMGVIQSLGALDGDRVLEIYAPKGAKKYFKSMCESIAFDFRVKVKLFEVSSGKVFENDKILVTCASLKHGVPCVGYSFKEKDYRKVLMNQLEKLGVPEGPHIGKLQLGEDIVWKGNKIKFNDCTKLVVGKKFSYVTDTLLVDNCYKLAQDSDLLVCEGTYLSDLKEKAEEYLHMTAEQASLLASKSGVKQLVLTHFSARYKSNEELEKEAKTYFNNVKIAYDFMKVKV